MAFKRAYQYIVVPGIAKEIMRALQYTAIPKGDSPTKQSMVVIKRYIHYHSYPSLASPPPEVVIIRYVC